MPKEGTINPASLMRRPLAGVDTMFYVAASIIVISAVVAFGLR